jgi:hypothetical protein
MSQRESGLSAGGGVALACAYGSLHTAIPALSTSGLAVDHQRLVCLASASNPLPASALLLDSSISIAPPTA